MFEKKAVMPTADHALPGRETSMQIDSVHFVNGSSMVSPFAENFELIYFGLGCFWGAERCFWQQSGVFTTAVGYAAGFTQNPTYEEVCSGLTGHNEVVMVVFDPIQLRFADLLNVFWEAHNPTQGMRQGNDTGTQYRSGIYTTLDSQMEIAQRSLSDYQSILERSGYGPITTEIKTAGPFYYAEDYHQQYLAKNPAGYCGLGGTGVSAAG